MKLKNNVTYLKMCQDLSQISKCAKHKVGALIIKDGIIVSNGVNGSPAGYTNCCDKFANVNLHIEPGKSDHRKWAEIYEIHAEMNAILLASKKGVSLENSTLYCNLEPCYNCLKHAVGCGIKNIFYSKKHKSNLESNEAKSLIEKLGIKITHLEIK